MNIQASIELLESFLQDLRSENYEQDAAARSAILRQAVKAREIVRAVGCFQVFTAHPPVITGGAILTGIDAFTAFLSPPMPRLGLQGQVEVMVEQAIALLEVREEGLAGQAHPSPDFGPDRKHKRAAPERDRVVSAMRLIPVQELDRMTDEELVVNFKGKRATCRDARKIVLSETVGRHKTD